MPPTDAAPTTRPSSASHDAAGAGACAPARATRASCCAAEIRRPARSTTSAPAHPPSRSRRPARDRDRRRHAALHALRHQPRRRAAPRFDRARQRSTPATSHPSSSARRTPAATTARPGRSTPATPGPISAPTRPPRRPLTARRRSSRTSRRPPGRRRRRRSSDDASIATTLRCPDRPTEPPLPTPTQPGPPIPTPSPNPAPTPPAPVVAAGRDPTNRRADRRRRPARARRLRRPTLTGTARRHPHQPDTRNASTAAACDEERLGSCSAAPPLAQPVRPRPPPRYGRASPSSAAPAARRSPSAGTSPSALHRTGPTSPAEAGRAWRPHVIARVPSRRDRRSDHSTSKPFASVVRRSRRRGLFMNRYGRAGGRPRL